MVLACGTFSDTGSPLEARQALPAIVVDLACHSKEQGGADCMIWG